VPRRRLQEENPYSFSWKIDGAPKQNELSFNFKFAEPQSISKYASDKIQITMLQPHYIKSSAYRIADFAPQEITLPKQMTSLAEAKTVEAVATTA